MIVQKARRENRNSLAILTLLGFITDYDGGHLV